MEKIIRDIIDADRIAREKVEQMEAQRYQLNSVLQEQRMKITEEYERASAEKKAAFQENLDAQLNQHKQQSEQEYEKTVHSLEGIFEEKKDSWVEEIYQRCLGNS